MSRHPSMCGSCGRIVVHAGHAPGCPLDMAGVPGRCPGCHWHLPTMGHCQDCPHGYRAWYALMPDGTWVHNPRPDEERHHKPEWKPTPLSKIEHNRILDAAERKADEKAARAAKRRSTA